MDERTDRPTDRSSLTYTDNENTHLWLAPAAAKAGESPFFTNRSNATAFGVDWTDEQMRGSFCLFYLFVFLFRGVANTAVGNARAEGRGWGVTGVTGVTGVGGG